MDLLRVIRPRGVAPWLSVVLLAVFVAGYATAPRRHAHAQLFSPGPLSRDHAQLEGDAHCDDCHSAGRRVSTQACLRCHTPLAARIRARQGLHGRTFQGRDCGSCHVEHLGVLAPQIRWPGGNRARFDHRETGWPLRGGHASAECADCHRGRSFLGASSACASCHEDPHEGRFGATCNQCHDERRWDHPVMTTFDHARTRFPLEGAHGQAPCAGCHSGEPPRYRGLEFESCSNCHRDPHEGRFRAPCAACHTETSFSDLQGARRHHPGLSLAHGHARVRCARCHDAGLDQPPRRGSACVACHRDVHEADFGRDCASCHRTIEWAGLPETVSRPAHDRTPFPLHGMHANVACDRCHDPSVAANARYRELAFQTCRGCHREDPHRGELNAFDGGECGLCHADTGFSPTLFGVAQHARTDFPLDGRHQAVACGQCHRSDRPRLTWTVASHACVDCHENPHGDQFRAEMERGGCAHCHATTGWDRPRIDHGIWPLTGAHAEAACGSCHRPTEEDRRGGRGASYRGIARQCAGCHADVHAGQFRLAEPVRRCTDCHSTTSFTVERFDHAQMTGFALEGRHERLRCAACHTPTRLRDGTRAVAWRLDYRECRDCHANPHVARTPAGHP